MAGAGAGSSPHTRGAHAGRSPEHQEAGIIPAYAGSTFRRLAALARVRDHPRIRGEHSTPPDGTVLDPGSSPHTRGARVTRKRADARPGIIPAYAGSTSQPASWPEPPPDHPRIRGEHAVFVGGLSVGVGSSPHTRGARGAVFGAEPVGGIIPAYAGSTATADRMSMETADHPRIRGEHFAPGTPTRPSSGSSPHTRGARLRTPPRPRPRRIIPAYAGSTDPAPGSRPGPGDHPRIRGEHSTYKIGTMKATGSSPHTRGAQGDSGLGSEPVRIIPAYAGST